MPHVHFLTFGDGTPGYRSAVDRLVRQANRSRLFMSTKGYTLRSLRAEFPEFWHEHGAFIDANPRGLGYWLWKPFLIRETLSALPDGDFLIYADAGCEIHLDSATDIIDLLPVDPAQDLLAYNGGSDLGYRGSSHRVGEWTNAFTLDRIDKAREFTAYSQVWAGLLYLRNGEPARMLADKWFELSSQDSGALIIDRPWEDEEPCFIEHRHDQSILSLLVYSLSRSNRLGVKFRDYTDAYGAHATSPIRGSRNRTGISLIAAQRTPSESARLWLQDMSPRVRRRLGRLVREVKRLGARPTPNA